MGQEDPYCLLAVVPVLAETAPKAHHHPQHYAAAVPVLVQQVHKHLVP